MRWHAAILILLLACVLSKWVLATDTDIQIQDPSLAGMPLSDAEYDHFFKTLNSPRRASAVCFLRTMYGCQNALIQTLDLYENHGIVPEGRICSDLAEMPTFPDFCTLTFYRCTVKKYFVKRIQCPDDINETLAAIQDSSQEPGNTESSSTLEETPLISILPTTKTSSAYLTSASDIPTAATEDIMMTASATATETIPELPSVISVVTSSRKPSLTTEPVSSTPTTTDSESLLELLTSLDAVIAEQSFPKLFTTTGTNPTRTDQSFPQLLTVLAAAPSPSLVPTLPPFTSNPTTATPITSESVVTVSSAEPATNEAATSSMGSIPTNPATTVAPVSSPTSAFPRPIITATALVSLATTTKQSCSILPFSSSSTASKTSMLLIKLITPKNPPHLFPPANVADWPVLPISAILGQYPLQPTPIVQLFVLSPGFGPRKPKPPSAIAIPPLLPTAVGPAYTWQKPKIPEPQKNSPTTANLENVLQTNPPTTVNLENFLQTNPPTTAKLKNVLQTNSPTTAKLKNVLQTNSPTTAQLENLLLQLQNRRVQQLMQKIRELMANRKTLKEPLFQSTSLQLLGTLKHVKWKKSAVPLVSNNQLQRSLLLYRRHANG